MKASELIKELKEYMDNWGDIDVKIITSNLFSTSVSPIETISYKDKTILLGD